MVAVHMITACSPLFSTMLAQLSNSSARNEGNSKVWLHVCKSLGLGWLWFWSFHSTSARFCQARINWAMGHNSRTSTTVNQPRYPSFSPTLYSYKTCSNKGFMWKGTKLCMQVKREWSGHILKGQGEKMALNIAVVSIFSESSQQYK